MYTHSRCAYNLAGASPFQDVGEGKDGPNFFDALRSPLNVFSLTRTCGYRKNYPASVCLLLLFPLLHSFRFYGGQNKDLLVPYILCPIGLTERRRGRGEGEGELKLCQ